MVRRLAVIMFTDIAGHASLSQIDEAAGLRLLQEQDGLVRGLLEIHRGRLVKPPSRIREYRSLSVLSPCWV